MIKRWIIPIMGFQQDASRINGFDRLWKEIRHLSNGTTEALVPQRWRANFDSLSEFIHRHSADQPKIFILAYSWGNGHGAISLSKQLAKRGMRVSHAVMCDPVYHSWARPWRALILSPEIIIPDEVDEVSWLRQFQNKPQGTDLIRKDGSRRGINMPIVLNRTHEYMDDAPEFHKLCMDVISK